LHKIPSRIDCLVHNYNSVTTDLFSMIRVNLFSIQEEVGYVNSRSDYVPTVEVIYLRFRLGVDLKGKFIQAS